MIGKICEIIDDGEMQLKIGYPHLETGSFVLVTRDLGGGFFYALSDVGQTLVCSEYLELCQILSGSEN